MAYYWNACRVNTGSNEGIHALTEEELDKMLLEDVSIQLPELCNHNSWDNLRTKKDIVALRCRECSLQWKAPKDYIDSRKCEPYWEGKCEDLHCQLLHIHKFKLSLKMRNKKLKEQELVQQRVQQEQQLTIVTNMDSSPMPPQLTSN